MKRLLFVLALYPSWLCLEALHESGHVLHALLSGGRVARVYFHPLDFSRTDLSFNPHPRFVAWGGPIWGCVFPLLALALATLLHLPFRRFLRFFAGLCLIVNGAYIGAGWTLDRAGDAATLLRHGASPWTMSAFGLADTGLGLYLWHRLGPLFRVTSASSSPTPADDAMPKPRTHDAR